MCFKSNTRQLGRLGGAQQKSCMQVEKGATAAVFGLGAVGLAVIEALVEVGASRIFAIDTNPNKFAAATAWGATDCINPKVRRRACCCFELAAVVLLLRKAGARRWLLLTLLLECF